MTTTDGAVLGTTQIVNSGSPDQRYNLVLVAEGYRASDMAQFATDAQSFVTRLFATPPYDAFQDTINVYRVDVTSTDSGAADPVACGGTGATPHTFFDATFCGSGAFQRLLVVNNDAVLKVVTTQVPHWHMVLVLVNSPIYGGSGGPLAVFSMAPDADEIGLHEMGHTAFALADEYSCLLGCGVDTDRNVYAGGEPAQPNVTANANRATIKWGALIAPGTVVPTTVNADCTQCDPQPSPVPAGTVGAFAGAFYYHCGAYRGEFTCRMRELGNPFCAVCQQRIRATLASHKPPVPVLAGP